MPGGEQMSPVASTINDRNVSVMENLVFVAFNIISRSITEDLNKTKTLEKHIRERNQMLTRRINLQLAKIYNT